MGVWRWTLTSAVLGNKGSLSKNLSKLIGGQLGAITKDDLDVEIEGSHGLRAGRAEEDLGLGAAQTWLVPPMMTAGSKA
eukprot:9211811-Ditylum_brightwellii.AAC.1